MAGLFLLLSAGAVNFVTLFWLLSHSQAVPPSRIMSVSLRLCGTASRKWSASCQYTFTVCEPVSSDDSDVGLPPCGNCGRPSDVVSTTVPVSGGTPRVLATSASSCAGVFAGSAGAALADGTVFAAIAAPVTATAAVGTIHLARLESCMSLS